MSVAVAAAKSESGIYERDDLLNGCQAVAQGVRLADVDVIAAYPIRPYTEVMDALSKIIADGQLDAEYIIADSEHSQFEIVKHASSVNARAFGACRRSFLSATVRWTIRAPSASSTTTQWRSATWAGFSAGSQALRKRSSTC
jgi:hypothetical protein